MLANMPSIVSKVSDVYGMSATSASVIVSEIGSINQFYAAKKVQPYAGKCLDM